MTPVDRAVATDDAGQDLRPAAVDADGSGGAHERRLRYPAGWPAKTSRTASTAEAVPLAACRPYETSEARAAEDGGPRSRAAPLCRPGACAEDAALRHGRIITLVVVGLIVFLIGWTVAGYLAVRRGVEEAKRRLGEPAKRGRPWTAGCSRSRARR